MKPLRISHHEIASLREKAAQAIQESESNHNPSSGTDLHTALEELRTYGAE